MPSDLIPFRTYATAAVLSLLVNVGTVGTLATVQFTGSSSALGISRTTSVIAPLVLNDLNPAPPSPAPDPDPDQRAPEAPAPPPTQPEPPEPVPVPAPSPQDLSTKLGNPDAPDSRTDVWVGVSKDPGAIRGARSVVDQAQFRPGLAGAPSDQATTQETASDASRADSAGPIPTPAPEQSKPTPGRRSETDVPKLQHDVDPAIQSSGQDGFGVTTPEPGEDMEGARPADAMSAAVLTTEDLYAVTLDSDRDATRVARRMIEAIAKAAQTAPVALARSAPNSTFDPQPSEAAATSDAAPTPPTPAPDPSASTGQDGNGADRESDAFSKTTPVDVRFGQPLAGKGLYIKTVAPRWTTATRVFYRPRNAVLRIKFGRDGRVLHAAYIDGQDAGPPELSGPLLDAAYRWTAKGTELNSIPADQPQTGIVIAFRIVWTD